MGIFGDTLAAAVQDHENGYDAINHIGAGLGVYHQSNNNSDDNITAEEQLILNFDRVVHLTEIQLRNDGHVGTWSVANASFLFDGVDTALAAVIPLDLTGQTFRFSFGGAHPDQFYLAGATAEDVRVPEPAGLGLLMVGLAGLMARAGRRTH